MDRRVKPGDDDSSKRRHRLNLVTTDRPHRLAPSPAARKTGTMRKASSAGPKPCRVPSSPPSPLSRCPRAQRTPKSTTSPAPPRRTAATAGTCGRRSRGRKTQGRRWPRARHRHALSRDAENQDPEPQARERSVGAALDGACGAIRQAPDGMTAARRARAPHQTAAMERWARQQRPHPLVLSLISSSTNNTATTSAGAVKPARARRR